MRGRAQDLDEAQWRPAVYMDSVTVSRGPCPMQLLIVTEEFSVVLRKVDRFSFVTNDRYIPIKNI